MQEVLSKIGYGLYVLTAKEGEKDNGCIINAVSQITSGNPTMVSIAVNKLNYTHDMILRTSEFNVSMLTEATPFYVFEHFGFQSGKTVNKFENCSTELRTQNGILYLPKFINGVFSGKVRQTIDLSTHTLFVAEVVETLAISDDPSLSYAYYQKNIKPQPQPQTEKKGGWRCKICGYVYEGEELPADFVCPWCKHGPEDFEPIV
ncbi:MAG: flavin reductase [Bacteroidales bacterium]|jgi:flavin reductase (DIM6/NTAB) family NADH-FMN oxidoreductase RutF|nr:flavin reductase [Bacteroidales bacterium]MBR4454047.1 flavin reductase [Bacteroidales bacterium]